MKKSEDYNAVCVAPQAWVSEFPTRAREHTNYRAVFGVNGDFAKAWSYDAYGSPEQRRRHHVQCGSVRAADQRHKQLQLRAGINNLFDKDPPLITSEIVAGGQANTYETYDTLGRQLYAAFTAKF